MKNGMTNRITTLTLAKAVIETRHRHDFDFIFDRANEEYVHILGVLNKTAERLVQEYKEDGTDISQRVKPEVYVNSDGEEDVVYYTVNRGVALSLMSEFELIVRDKVVDLILRGAINHVKIKAAAFYQKDNATMGIPMSKYGRIRCHGFTENRMYGARYCSDEKAKCAHEKMLKDVLAGVETSEKNYTQDKRKDSDDGLVRTHHYKDWLERFPIDDLPRRSYWEEQGVDFTKPLHVRLGFVYMPNFDMTNLEKSMIDYMFSSRYREGVYRADDKLVHKVTKQKFGECDSYRTGEIYVHIENLK